MDEVKDSAAKAIEAAAEEAATGVPVREPLRLEQVRQWLQENAHLGVELALKRLEDLHTEQRQLRRVCARLAEAFDHHVHLDGKILVPPRTEFEGGLVGTVARGPEEPACPLWASRVELEMAAPRKTSSVSSPRDAAPRG